MLVQLLIRSVGGKTGGIEDIFFPKSPSCRRLKNVCRQPLWVNNGPSSLLTDESVDRP